MKPCIHFYDVSLTPVDVTETRYDHNKKKHVKLKTPIIKKKTKIELGNLYDLFELVNEINHNINKIEFDGESYLNLNLKIKAYY